VNATHYPPHNLALTPAGYPQQNIQKKAPNSDLATFWLSKKLGRFWTDTLLMAW